MCAGDAVTASTKSAIVLRFRRVWVPWQRAEETRCPYLRNPTSNMFQVDERKESESSDQSAAGRGHSRGKKPTGDFKFEPKLISYITSKYASKSDMMYDETLWADIIEPMLPHFKEAGALRQVVSQLWNKEGSFILTYT